MHTEMPAADAGRQRVRYRACGTGRKHQLKTMAENAGRKRRQKHRLKKISAKNGLFPDM